MSDHIDFCICYILSHTLLVYYAVSRILFCELDINNWCSET